MFPDHHQPPPTHFAVNHHLAATTTSEEADSTNDVEVVRRPRGRPPGSKNKPKPPPPPPAPLCVTQEPDPCMSNYVLEVPGGSDIIAAVTRFCNHRNTGLCVLNGSGMVSNVSFLQPTTNTAVTFHGVFCLLSISATILPPSTSTMIIPEVLTANKFVVSLAAGIGGQTVGGIVLGPLIAVGTVYIMAASFNNPLYHRLPMEEDNHLRNDDSGSLPTTRDQPPA